MATFMGLVLGILAAAPTGSANRPISAAPAILAVYEEDWGRPSSGGPGLVAAVWGDGYAVWSENPLVGGPPFYAARVAGGRVNSLLARLAGDGLFSDERLSQIHFGPDARFTTLLVRSGGKELRMQSWHEWAEHDGRAIATGSGIEPLQGRPRLSVLRAQPADYLYYRAVWGELRSAIQGLLPARGHPVTGEAVMVQRAISWKTRQ